MRKTILSILLALCMMCTLLPVTAGADEPTGGSIAGNSLAGTMSFGYAYDVQRCPAFPGADDTITLSGLSNPYSSSGNSYGTSSAGSWTLSKVGAYSAISVSSTYLTSIVNNLASEYTGVTASNITVHELKDGSTHYAYGVVVAYDSNKGCAVFLGDSLSGGAGYLLSTTAQSANFSINAGITLRDLTKAIFLSPSSHTFTAATEGYAAQTPLTVTVTNNGNAATGALNVTLSDDNANAFTLSTNKIDGIAVGNTATFTVAPITGLAAGNYTATVTVSNSGSTEFTPNPDGASTNNNTNNISETLTVTFTVNEGEATPEPPAEPTHDHTRRQNTTTTTDTTPATTVASPKTGDVGIAVYAALSIMSMTGSAWIIGTKRRH